METDDVWIKIFIFQNSHPCSRHTLFMRIKRWSQNSSFRGTYKQKSDRARSGFMDGCGNFAQPNFVRHSRLEAYVKPFWNLIKIINKTILLTGPENSWTVEFPFMVTAWKYDPVRDSKNSATITTVRDGNDIFI